MTMPHNLTDTSVPEPATDPKPVDDFIASAPADRVQIDGWREKLAVIRGEILELAEQGSRHGLADLGHETVELARILEQLEALLSQAEK